MLTLSFFEGPKAGKRHWNMSKKQVFIERATWVSSWTAGKHSSSLLGRTERSSEEPTWESDPAHFPVQQDGVETSNEQGEESQTSCKQPITRKQESALPVGYDNVRW